jgi:hypothetical protein
MRRTPSPFEATKAGGAGPARGVTSNGRPQRHRGAVDRRDIPAVRRQAGRAAGTPNPAADAKLMSDTLFSLGFFVVGGGARLDLDKRF